MDLDQLRTFLAVIAHSSFTRAAEALQVRQSTVSFHIKALEAAAGTRLVDRGRGRVRPTPAGAVLRPYAERLVGLRDEALARLRAEDQGAAGRVTIAASTVAAEYLLPPVLAEFRRTHPGVNITVTVSDSRAATAALFAEQCDLALVGARIRDKRAICTPFADDEIVVVAPAGSEGQPAIDVTRLPLIVREDGSGTREAVSALLARDPWQRTTIQVGSSEAAKRCVLHGVGVTFISRRVVAEELESGRLRVIPADGTPVRRRIYVARLRSLTPSAAARAMIRTIHQKRR